ncbi:MAG: c-type cytochrome [Thermoleophilaceae bacterium]|nr:c-type cytochrome [Thermoleophilaceae bacterium]
MRIRVRLLSALAAAALALPLAACGRNEPDLSNGKALFTQKCGSCHALGRAGTQGQTGPDLDTAFRAALAKGINRETVEGIVHEQVLHPRANSTMPAGLVTDKDAEDVAAYVGFAVDRPGDDQGALAQAGLGGATTGEQIFTAAGCAGCHQLSKAGANGTIGPSLDDLASSSDIKGSPEDYVREALLDPDAVVAQGFQAGVMPSFEGKLTDKQIQALVQYLLGD